MLTVLMLEWIGSWTVSTTCCSRYSWSKRSTVVEVCCSSSKVATIDCEYSLVTTMARRHLCLARREAIQASSS